MAFRQSAKWIALICLALPQLLSAAEALQVENAWQPHLPAVIPVRAGYLTLRNDSDRKVVIIGASSPEFSSVEIHRSSTAQGVASMERLRTLELAPMQTVLFEPEGLHLMLRGPQQAHSQGDTFAVVLHLKDGQSHMFTMQVQEPVCQHCGHAHHEH